MQIFKGIFINNDRYIGSGLAAATALILTTLNIAQTYGGYFGEAYKSLGAYGLFALNLTMTFLFIFLLQYIVKLEGASWRYWLLALFVALSLPSLIHADFGLASVLPGSEKAGSSFEQPSINLGELVYDPATQGMTASMNVPVILAKQADVFHLQNYYQGDAGLTELILDVRVLYEISKEFLSEEEKKVFTSSFPGIVADESMSEREKIRTILLLALDIFPRKIVVDMTKGL